MELRADPEALAPERLLVFELRGSIANFAAAVRNIPGLELIDEEELSADNADRLPVAYLMVPDTRALRELESLWRRWLAGHLQRGETPWRDVFALLRDLRPWGPGDRVQDLDTNSLQEDIFGMADHDLVRLEIELVYRDATMAADRGEKELLAFLRAEGGEVIATSRIAEIAYHAMLVDLPVRQVQKIIERTPDGVAGIESVMHIRPQSVATRIDLDGEEAAALETLEDELGDPILAILDGVPVAAHSLLANHVVVDDQFGLEPITPVADRVHGTAMASLVIHGDRNNPAQSLPRRVHIVPVLGPSDKFPKDSLLVDLVYRAILTMRQGRNPTAPGVVVVNISLGNARRPFHGQLSPWARLLDRLAYRFGILFVVSVGNCTEPFAIDSFTGRTDYEDAHPDRRAHETLRALGTLIADRRMLSPSETINGLTVGASNEDHVSHAVRAAAAGYLVDPYGDRRMANPSSALGPGFALSVKPDVLMPAGREHVTIIRNGPPIQVKPSRGTRATGLRVAAPLSGGRENAEGYTSGTSAAAALASRVAHRIHDALEAEYGDAFRALPAAQRAVLLKALVVHPAQWPLNTAGFMREILGPPGGRHHARQKDNIRRFLGFGFVDAEDAVACAADRATFWFAGDLPPNRIAIIDVPIPIAIGGQARPHSIAATLAWFTPTSPGRRSYRAVRLKILEPNELTDLRASACRDQPDGNQTNRGTVFSRRWTGARAPIVSQDMSLTLTVQRDRDQGVEVEESVPFGLAVTVSMPGVIELYDQVRQRLGIAQRARA
jgi:hypothetical protein